MADFPTADAVPTGRASGTDLRRSILDTARRILLDDGYERLSMRRIAGDVGCSATSIYLHFEGKDDLVHALIDEGMENLHAALEVAAPEPEEGPLARLEAMSRAYVRFGLENPEYYEIMFTLHPERMERYPPEKYRRARRNLDLFAEALRAASDRGEAEIDDPRVAASVLWAALHGAVTLVIARRLDVSIDRETFIGAAVARIIRGFGRRAG